MRRRRKHLRVQDLARYPLVPGAKGTATRSRVDQAFVWSPGADRLPVQRTLADLIRKCAAN